MREMESLRHLALELTSELDYNKLLHTITHAAAELLHATGSGIYEYEPEEGLLRVVADYGGRSTIKGHTLKVGEGLTGRVVAEGRAMRVDDYSSWPHRSPHLEPDLFRAVAAHLLQAPDERILGVLYVTDDVEGRVFSEHEMSLLGLLSAHAAIAIRNAKLLAEKQLSLTQVELISRVDESIREALNLEELLRMILNVALRAVGADEGSVMILDHEKNVLEVGAWMFRGQKVEKPHPVLELGQGIAGHVAETGREYYCSDTSKDPHYEESFTGRRIRSILSVPIVYRGLVLGIVNADSERSGAFSEHDLQKLKTLANHAAQALEAQRFRDFATSLPMLPEEEMYRSVVKNACILSGAEASMIFLKDGDTVTRKAVFPLSPVSESGEVRDSGIVREILTKGVPLIIHDAQSHPDVKQSLKLRGIKSLVGVPLNARLGDESQRPVAPIGVLFVSSTRRREFGERDLEILQSIANQAAVVITRTRLNSQLIALYHITEQMQSEQDLSSLLNLVSDKAVKLLGADAGGILMHDSGVGGRRLSFKSSYGLSSEFLEAVRNTEGEALVADMVIESRGPVIVNDVERHARFISPASQAENIKAVISTPLLIKDEIIGTLDVYSKTHHRAFDEEALRILSLLANQAALAISKTSLIGEISRTRDTARAVAELTSLVSLDEALESVVDVTRTALACDSVVLYVLDPSSGKLRLPPVMAGVRQPDAVQTAAAVPEDSVVYAALRLGKMYVAEDVAADTLLAPRRFAREEGIVSCVAFPLMVQGDKVGVMFVNYRTRHSFTNSELNNIRLFAQQTAIAIRNAQLFEKVNRRAQILGVLNEAGQAVSGALREEEIFRRTAAQAVRLVGRGDVKRASVWRSEVSKLRLAAAYPENPAGAAEDLHEIGLPAGTGGRIGIVGRAFTNSSSQVVGDVREDPDYISLHPEILSQVAVPISSVDKLVGVLCVESSALDAFDEDDCAALESLAAHAAAAVRIAHQHWELLKSQRLIGARTTLALMGMETTARYHVIANTVASSRNWLWMLRQHLNEAATAGSFREKNLALIDNLDQTLRALLEDRIIAPTSSRGDDTPQDINEFVAEFVKRWQSSERHPGVEFSLSLEQGSPALAVFSRQWLREAFNVLVENAVKAMSESRDKILRVETSQTSDMIHIRFTDTGRGVPTEVRAQLFHKQIRKESGEEGLGIGLLLASTILELYGGKLQLAETGPQGTTFVASLPLVR